jgi:hypothetical protein
MTPQGVGYMSRMDRRLDAELHTSSLQGEFLAIMGCHGSDQPKLTFQQDNDPTTPPTSH